MSGAAKRTWTLAGALAVGMLLAVHGHGLLAPDAASATVASADVDAEVTTSSTPAFSTASLQGDWYLHGSYLEIEPDGSFELSYRIYEWCDDGESRSADEPCDDMVGNQIIDGGHATGRFDTGTSPHWEGTVELATAHTGWTRGPVHASYDPATDTLQLRQDGASAEPATFCGPAAEPGTCGA